MSSLSTLSLIIGSLLLTEISLSQGSSVGSCNKVWLKEFYHSASGASAQDWVGKQKKADRLPWPENRGIKILFPTLRTVRESRLGEAVSLSLSPSDAL
jgi:hypothetical protein